LVLIVPHEVESRWIARGLAGELREGIGKGTIAIPSGVLVDEGGPRARVTHAGHELLGACSRRRCQRVARVPEVVEVEAPESHRLAGWLPEAPIEIAAPQRRSIGRREDQARLVRADIRLEMAFKIRDHMGRQRDHSSAGISLRRSFLELSILELLELTLDADSA
jgi:hypothetical protein